MNAMTENPSSRLRFPARIIPSSSSLSEISSNVKPEAIPKLLPHKFPTHLDAPDVSPGTRTLCEILTRASPIDIEHVLSRSVINPIPEIVTEVLKYSYNAPSSAVKFFRWAGRHQKHSASAWNLMVDLLGKNQLFEPMWDAVRSMKQEVILSISTFGSVFESYCTAHRFDEAVMSFDVMAKYGVEQDIVVVNLLLSRICSQENQTSKAFEFFDKIKGKISPNGNTFTILLKGWEKEGNATKAKSTFGEMVLRVGWDPANKPAYHAFLMTLIRESQADEAVKFLRVLKNNDCLLDSAFYSSALDFLVNKNDLTNASSLWETMAGSGLLPSLAMYNSLIGLFCCNNNILAAFLCLDEMAFNGAFPNSLTYNMIFQCLVKNRKVRESGKFFFEMIKNECPPTHSNYAAAIEMLLQQDDPEMAIEIWDYMVENRISPLEASANALLLGLCNMGRLLEVKSYAENMLDKKIQIYETTIAELKNTFYKKSRSMREKFDSLSRRWKAA